MKNKTNRTDDIGVISIVSIEVLFWIPLICAAIGIIRIAFCVMVAYTLFNIMFWYSVLKNEPIWKSLIGFFIMEILEIILFVIVLFIKGLL